MPAAKKKAKKVIDPFKVKKTATSGGKKSLDSLEPPENLKPLVDEFRQAAENAKKYEAEKKALSAQIKPWAMEKAAERRLNGINSNFNISGENTTCQFQMQDKIGGIDEEYLNEFTSMYSEKAADTLFKTDYGAIKFNAKYLEQHFEEIIGKMTDALGEHMEHLFKETTLKLEEGGLDKAKKFAKTPEELAELFQAMKVISFIK